MFHSSFRLASPDFSILVFFPLPSPPFLKRNILHFHRHSHMLLLLLWLLLLLFWLPLLLLGFCEGEEEDANLDPILFQSARPSGVLQDFSIPTTSAGTVVLTVAPLDQQWGRHPSTITGTVQLHLSLDTRSLVVGKT